MTNKIGKTIAVSLAIVFTFFSAPAQSRSNPAPGAAEAKQAGSLRFSSAFEEIKFPKNLPNPRNLQQYRMRSNGLSIILGERHDAPVLCTYVVYKVGSRNEAVGYTGATHFLEHLMFKGTHLHDPLQEQGLDDLLKPIGGYNNATTSYDRTNYFEVVPTGNLDACLEFEADRMHNLLLRQSDRSSEMTVVRNELEGTLDDPSALLQTNLFATAFQEHPYHHPTIGWRSDVEGVPLKRLREFYQEYYWPDNATLVLIGDFDHADALKKIEKYFGHLAPSPHGFPKVYTIEPPQEGERRFVVQRGSQMPRVVLGFHTPNAVHKDDYAIAVIESILGDESKRSSRLYKSLIDSGLASDVSAYSYELRDPGMFTVSATALSNGKLDQIENVLWQQVEKLSKEPVSQAELDRAKRSIVKHLKLSVTDPVGLGDEITDSVACADLKWLLEYPVRVEAVTTEDILKAARKYFKTSNKTVGYYLPREEPKSTEVKVHTLAEEPGPAAIVEESADGAASDLLREAPTVSALKSAPFAKQVVTKVLKNGLTISVMPVPGSGAVAISGRSLAGSFWRDHEKTQVPDLVADMLTKGSAKFSKERLAQRLEDMGSSLTFTSDEFFLSFDTEVTREDYSSFLDLLADCLKNPLYQPGELDKAKEQRQSSLRDRLSDTSERAQNIFCQTAYLPDSAYFEKPFENQISELSSITDADLHRFHAAHITPSNTVLSIVGDINSEDAFALARRKFENWTGAPRTALNVKEEIYFRAKPQTVAVSLPDKANANVLLGKPIPVSVKTSDYFATLIANAALGFDSFACRLAPVRDQYGLTYDISSAISNAAQKYSPWLISFTVNPNNIQKAVALVKTIVSHYVSDGITSTELANEKSHLAGTFLVSLRSQKQIAARLSEYDLLNLGAQYMDDYGKNLQAVKMTAVNSAIKKYFSMNDAITAISGTIPPDKK